MGFEEAYKAFLDKHRQARKGERLRRLEEGHGNAEMMFLQRVWWPLFYEFQHLHPEYEVSDFKDGSRYLDFAYIRPGMRICFEIDGYGPHLKNMSRWQFSDSLDRQNQLMIDGWKVIRFSYDQVKDQPRRCQQVIQQIIGRLNGDEMMNQNFSPLEKEVLRFALRKGKAITLQEACQLLELSSKPVRSILKELVRKRMLSPASGTQRVHSYRLGEGVKSPFLEQ